jgi:hypothetical protein
MSILPIFECSKYHVFCFMYLRVYVFILSNDNSGCLWLCCRLTILPNSNIVSQYYPALVIKDIWDYIASFRVQRHNSVLPGDNSGYLRLYRLIPSTGTQFRPAKWQLWISEAISPHSENWDTIPSCPVTTQDIWGYIASFRVLGHNSVRPNDNLK